MAARIVRDDGAVRYPSLFQINIRVWLTALARRPGLPATLDDIPEQALDRIAELDVDWVWLLSVWQTGEAGRLASRSNEEWRREFEATLPDLADEDIGGSGFAIAGYTVDARMGGDAALARLRERLRARGLRLMLDFVPNHMALDHPWVEEHPEYFVAGTEADLARSPANYTRDPPDPGRSGARARPRSVFPWLARHAAARLRQARPCRTRW